MVKANISLYLDKRRKKDNGKFPVKIRVFTSKPRKQKFYPTIFEFTEKEYASIWESSKTRSELKNIKNQLSLLESSLIIKANEIQPFSFPLFELSVFKAPNIDESDLFIIFDEVIKEKENNGNISTAEKYSLSKKSFQNYLTYKNLSNKTLSISIIDVSFLNGYKIYSENIKNLSSATIAIYLRNLRTIYRIGLDRGLTAIDNYPFTKKGFSIPSSKKVNKALSEKELKQLWITEPQDEKQAIAKDFWFLSYYSYGMNIKDICELKHQSIDGESFSYIRAKTKNTKKEQVIKEVPITEAMKAIIDRRKKLESSFLFGIISEKDTASQKHSKVKLFNDLINKHFRKFALYSGLDSTLCKQLGTYHARHSFATVAIKKGYLTAQISEILHDGNLKTTQNYINSFPKESFKELSKGMEL